MALLLTLRDRTAPWLGVPHGKQRRFDCAQVLPIRQWLRGRSASILGASHLMPGLGLERTASLADIEPHRMFPSTWQEEWRECSITFLTEPWAGDGLVACYQYPVGLRRYVRHSCLIAQACEAPLQ